MERRHISAPKYFLGREGIYGTVSYTYHPGMYVGCYVSTEYLRNGFYVNRCSVARRVSGQAFFLSSLMRELRDRGGRSTREKTRCPQEVLLGRSSAGAHASANFAVFVAVGMRAPVASALVPTFTLHRVGDCCRFAVYRENNERSPPFPLSRAGG